MNFEQKISEYIEKFHLLETGETVCVGLSGGADSLALLLVLRGLGYPVSAVHVNHNLRGRASREDENFVRKICEEYRIPLSVYSYAVAEIAANRKLGEEEAGRLVRQSAYADCVAKGKADKIALAHHANDLAETFVFRAARGSSLHGMAGIRPSQKITVETSIWENSEKILYAGVYDRDEEENAAETRKLEITVIHPLLGVTRAEIEDYLREKNQEWQTDQTNLDEGYVRNGIRMKVIPFLEEHVNGRAVTHIAALAEDLDMADAFLREEAGRRAKKLMVMTVASVMVENAFMDEPVIIQNYILMEALVRMNGSAKDIGREQLRQLRNLFYRRSGSQLDLPYHLMAVRDYEGITIMYNMGKSMRKSQEEIPVTVPGTIHFGMWTFFCSFDDPARFDQDKIKGIQYTKWFDYDKIKDALVFRKRIKGDRIVINSDGGSRKLKDYLIDEKVPERERDDIPLLASGGRIFWVVGHRTGEDCRVTDKTKRILRIEAKQNA